ncbi:MAG: spore coat protein CotJB [Oscillospiraceae bacterium]|nr:spore coat protein CotJB [Oscillospiraceae bacterium]
MNSDCERKKCFPEPSVEVAVVNAEKRRQLAVPIVEAQKDAEPVYGKQEALAQGTLFPELDLPFHLMVKGVPVPSSPLSDLQALSFVVAELGLYLDTHPDDKEAFRMFQSYVKLEKQARARFEEDKYPLEQCSAARDDSYTWLKDPWPWNLQKEV